MCLCLFRQQLIILAISDSQWYKFCTQGQSLFSETICQKIAKMDSRLLYKLNIYRKFDSI